MPTIDTDNGLDLAPIDVDMMARLMTKLDRDLKHADVLDNKAHATVSVSSIIIAGAGLLQAGNSNLAAIIALSLATISLIAMLQAVIATTLPQSFSLPIKPTWDTVQRYRAMTGKDYAKHVISQTLYCIEDNKVILEKKAKAVSKILELFVAVIVLVMVSVGFTVFGA